VKLSGRSNEDDEPRHVRDSIDGVARRLGGSAVVPLARLLAKWDDIVGPAVAAHVTPAAVRDGVLVVDVDQPIWRTQLGFLEADLLRRVHEVSGLEIARIEARVRPI
jgi:predicted nucleic acid-binding Zn ribbon protein